MSKHYRLTLSCSAAVARKRWEHSTAFLTKDDYDTLISQDAIGTLNGKLKFVVLKCAYGGAKKFYSELRKLKYSKSKRGVGQDALFGVDYDARNGPPRFTNMTQSHWWFYEAELTPLLEWIGDKVRRKLPAYWKEQRQVAKRQPLPRYDTRQFREQFAAQLGDYMTRPLSWYELHRDLAKQSGIFSEVTINRTALFTPHRDWTNKGLACQMVFGDFAGGDLCFPQLRVAFRLRPGDLLIADTKHEYHGTVGGIWDDRISVVAYLR